MVEEKMRPICVTIIAVMKETREFQITDGELEALRAEGGEAKITGAIATEYRQTGGKLLHAEPLSITPFAWKES